PPRAEIVLVLREACTAPEELHQQIRLREATRGPKESDRPVQSQHRVGILSGDVYVVCDQEDRNVALLLQPIEGLVKHIFASDVDGASRLVEEQEVRPIEDRPRAAEV